MTKFSTPSGMIIVTGASGWVGRSILEQLVQLMPQDELHARLRAFSSKASLIHLADGQTIVTQPLTSLPVLAEQEKCSFILHTAFLTPDRCIDIGRETYTAINRSITKLVETAVCSSPGVRVVQFSSGAAALAQLNHCRPSSSTKLYGALKLDEEQRLQAVAPTLVLRIYALSGRYIRDPRRYAIGDLISQAILGISIRIQSASPVVRGYVHADCLAQVAIRWLLSELAAPGEPVNAITHEVEIVDLARSVAEIFGNLDVRTPETTNSNQSVYTNSPDEFLALAKTLNVNIPTLAQQVQDTALGLASLGVV